MPGGARGDGGGRLAGRRASHPACSSLPRTRLGLRSTRHKDWTVEGGGLEPFRDFVRVPHAGLAHARLPPLADAPWIFAVRGNLPADGDRRGCRPPAAAGVAAAARTARSAHGEAQPQGDRDDASAPAAPAAASADAQPLVGHDQPDLCPKLFCKFPDRANAGLFGAPPVP